MEPQPRSRQPARRARRALGAASITGFAAIGGAVALGTDAGAAPATSTTDGTGTDGAATTAPTWSRGMARGPLAGTSGSPAPDSSSHGS